MKNVKKLARIRRARKSRAIARRLNAVRLCVHKTPQHIYAQIISPDTSDKVIVAISTLTPDVRKQLEKTGNVDAAKLVGTEIAKAALKAGITKVSFDRSGYPYHGRIKALAEKAREHGLQF
jgi:large subunit ribosomal protein L18